MKIRKFRPIRVLLFLLWGDLICSLISMFKYGVVILQVSKVDGIGAEPIFWFMVERFDNAVLMGTIATGLLLIYYGVCQKKK